MESIGLLLLLQVVLIALNAIFASAEIAVLSINEAKLERMANEGNNKAKRLFKLSKEPAKFLATIQVAITLSGFLGSAFAADNFSEPLVNFVISLGVTIPRATLDAIAVILITLILSYFTLIFGELVPKRLAMKKSEQIAMGISGLVSGVAVVFRPIVWFLSVSTNIVLRLFRIDPNEADDEVSEEEIRLMVDAGSEKGTIDTQEKEFIQNVFEFNDLTAGEIAVHRTDVIALMLEDSLEIWDEIICRERHTRYLVCDGSMDNVVGILNAKDYFAMKEKTKEGVLDTAVHNAYFVPDTITADVLFLNMKKTHSAMAVVLDEYGGMQGIVTMQNLLETLVGDLGEEEPDPENPEPSIEKVDDHTWKIHKNVPLADLETEIGITLESNDFETFSGLVFSAIGSIPEDGDQRFTLMVEGMEIEILKIEAHQIEDAIIKLQKPSDSEE